MKLTIINQFYPPDYAATGQLVEEVAVELAKHGVDVQVFVGQPGYAFDQPLAIPIETSKGVHIRRTRTSRIWPQRLRGRAISGFLYCLRAIVKLRFRQRLGDLILATTEPPYLPVVAYILHLMYKTPYVCLIYDVYPDIAVTLGVIHDGHWVVRIWHWLNQQTWKNAAAIIVLTESMKQVILQRSPQLADKIQVIHNWADGTQIQPRHKHRNWFAQAHGLDQQFTILYSGNLGRCHDLQTIMDAALLLAQAPVQFVFIGAGAKLPICQDFVTEHGLTNCLFLPFQSKDVLPFSLTACDLTLVTISRDVEGLIAPSKFYGCLASGKAIAAICPSHSYLREIIVQAGCGRAIENGDAQGLASFILELRNDAGKLQAMGQRARQYFEDNFTLEKISCHYLKITQSVAGTHQCPHPRYPLLETKPR